MTIRERKERMALRLRRRVPRLSKGGDFDIDNRNPETGDRAFYSSRVHRRLSCEARAWETALGRWVQS